MLYIAWKRGLPQKFACFVLFHPIKKRSFNLLCVLDLGFPKFSISAEGRVSILLSPASSSYWFPSYTINSAEIENQIFCGWVSTCPKWSRQNYLAWWSSRCDLKTNKAFNTPSWNGGYLKLYSQDLLFSSEYHFKSDWYHFKSPYQLCLQSLHL